MGPGRGEAIGDGPVIETERLALRRFTLEDVDRVLDTYGDPEVTRYLGDGRPLDRRAVEKGIRETLHRYATHGIGMLCLTRRGDSAILGHAGLQRWEGTPDVELGYLLRRDAWGMGYATEAAAAALSFAFANLDVPRIVAVARPENRRSIGVMERVGMTFRKRTTDKGQPVVLYAAARPTPLPRASSP